MANDAAPIPRPTARVLVIDEDDRVLLIEALEGEYRGSGQRLWLTPGGGLDHHEAYEQAALRELREEVGLTEVALGPCVWTRRLPYALQDGVLREKHERYFVCRVPHFDVNPAFEEALDLEAVGSFRWWSAAEIEASDDVFAPRALGRLLRNLIEDGAPTKPVEIGL